MINFKYLDLIIEMLNTFVNGIRRLERVTALTREVNVTHFIELNRD